MVAPVCHVGLGDLHEEHAALKSSAAGASGERAALPAPRGVVAAPCELTLSWLWMLPLDGLSVACIVLIWTPLMTPFQ